jgi:hypothetical protein
MGQLRGLLDPGLYVTTVGRFILSQKKLRLEKRRKCDDFTSNRPFPGSSSFGFLRKILWTKWKILSNGMRSFETLDMMPVFSAGNSDGSKGRLSFDAEDPIEEVLWRDVRRVLGPGG